MLIIQSLSYRIGERLLLDSAQLAIADGCRIGLIGRNGCGKTTLLRLTTGELDAESGRIDMPRRARIALVSQEAPGGMQSAIDTVLAADRERQALLGEVVEATDPQRIADIHTRLDDIDSHSAPARAAAILAGLGFDAAAQLHPVEHYSGGERMRVAIAAALFAEPELLLLDEPTNHLDFEATLWLTGYLANYAKTLIVVSHDRQLLNSIPTDIVLLENGKLARYSGNFDRFQRTRLEQISQASREQKKVMARRRHMQAFVDRFRYKATKARQAQSRIKALAKLPPVEPLVERAPVAFDFPEPPALPPPLITLERVAAGYDGRPVLRDLDLRLDADDRIALLGANGNGKSTLAKLLAGKLAPLHGTLIRGTKLRVGYFAQHQSEELDYARTAIHHMSALMPSAPERRVRAHLGRFGLAQQTGETTVANLSGGEKARLLIALMCPHTPHVLILDEPTNHLDIDSRAALVDALNAFSGAVVLVTHDRHIVSMVADRLWLVADGACRPFDGDVDDYEASILRQRRLERRRGTDGSREPTRRDARKAAAAQRAELARWRKAARQAEAGLSRLAAARRKVEEALADPRLYEGPPSRIAELNQLKAKLGAEIAAAETTWLDAQAKFEARSAEV